MKRLIVSLGLVGCLFNGCTVLVETGQADPAPIRPTQFLRPTFDAQTGTWVANWVDPGNFQEFAQ